MRLDVVRPQKREIEAGPLVGFTFRPDPSAVTVDDTLDQYQSDPCSFVIGGTVEALEDPEESIVVFHINFQTFSELAFKFTLTTWQCQPKIDHL